VALAQRLALDQQALRARIEVLESSKSHAGFLSAASKLRESKSFVDGFIDLDGWAVGRHELNLVHDLNSPDSKDSDGAALDLDVDREGSPLWVIAHYARELRERGIDLLVVPVPNRVQVWPDRLPDGAKPDPGGGGDLGSARLLLALSEAGVEVVDLSRVFAAEREHAEPDPGDRLFRDYNPHWAPRAVVLTADAIVARVRRMEWYEPGPEHEGVDFFLHRERLQHTFANHGSPPTEYETFWFDLVLDGSRELIVQDDRDSPVLILGDSYSDIYRTSGADIAVELYARLGFKMDRIAVPNGGANTVWQAVARRRDELRGKKLVIWIFRMSEFTNPKFRAVDPFAG